MTSSRVVRGTKGRIVLCICAIVVITGIIACYNNTLSQLEDATKANEQCHQQQENLSTQLQVIYDYKQRLEKSLKTEKADHQITKKDLEAKLEDERTKQEKATNEANLKFSSLQQHYNLLQTEHEDLKEENSKIQQEHMHEINDLKAKLKEVQGQLKQSINEKESAFEHLKTKYLQLQLEKENLEKQIRGTQSTQQLSENELNHLQKVNQELQHEIDQIKAKCALKLRDDVLSAPKMEDISKHNFSKQVKISDSVYQIQDANNPKQDNNVADLPSNAGSAMQPIQSPALNQLDSPNENQNPPEQNENVLVAPRGQKSSSTTSKTVSKASLDAVQPLNMPTVTPSNNKSKPSAGSRMASSNHVLAAPFGYKNLPAGVVPAPNAPLEPVDESKNKKDEKERDIREDVNNAFPNRYRNNLILNEIANEDKAIEADRQEQKNEKGKPNVFRSADVGDRENNAVEVFDPPVEKEKDLFGLDDLHDKAGKKHDIKLDGAAHKAYDAQDAGDYDKEVQNDMQLEENDPEADDGPMQAVRIPRDVIRR